jgi:hypothetical protein
MSIKNDPAMFYRWTRATAFVSNSDILDPSHPVLLTLDDRIQGDDSSFISEYDEGDILLGCTHRPLQTLSDIHAHNVRGHTFVPRPGQELASSGNGGYTVIIRPARVYLNIGIPGRYR